MINPYYRKIEQYCKMGEVFQATVDQVEQMISNSNLPKTIEQLNLSNRSTNALLANNITTVRQVLEMTSVDFLRCIGVGETCYKEVIEALRPHDVTIGTLTPRMIKVRAGLPY